MTSWHQRIIQLEFVEATTKSQQDTESCRGTHQHSNLAAINCCPLHKTAPEEEQADGGGHAVRDGHTDPRQAPLPGRHHPQQNPEGGWSKLARHKSSACVCVFDTRCVFVCPQLNATSSASSAASNSTMRSAFCGTVCRSPVARPLLSANKVGSVSPVNQNIKAEAAPVPCLFQSNAKKERQLVFQSLSTRFPPAESCSTDTRGRQNPSATPSRLQQGERGPAEGDAGNRCVPDAR